MITLLINLLISLIFITVIVIGIYNYLPEIDRILKEKLKISLFGKSKNHGLLENIFYKYNHKSSEAWAEWAIKQDAETQSTAIEQLISHIGENPANWGLITQEAIIALAKFANPDHIEILRNVISLCKKHWKQFKVIDYCYEAALKGLIIISEEEAKFTLKQEVDKIRDDTQAICIINALKSITTEVGSFFVKILSDDRVSYAAKNQAIAVIDDLEQESKMIFIDTIKAFLDKTEEPPVDSLRIFEQLLAHATQEIDVDSFDLLMKCCTHEFLANTSIRMMDLILKTNHENFDQKQIFMLTNLAKDEKQILEQAMASVFNLSADEKELTRHQDPFKIYPFRKAVIAEEEPNKNIETPKILKTQYDKLREVISQRLADKQNGISGGIVITGYSDLEKLFLVRVYAHEKRWNFIYSVFEDLMGSPTTSKTLQEKILALKPCVLYLDEIESLIKHKEGAFVKILKQILADPLVMVFASLKDDADIDNNNVSTLFKNNPNLLGLFPKAMSISFVNDVHKVQILNEKISKLDVSREKQNFENFNILDPTDKMTAFEFEKYLAQYFKTSLLVHGKLIDSKEFEQLNALEFEGRDG